MQSNTIKVTSNDLPASQRAASELSMRAQKRYLWLIGINLVLLIVGAGFSSLALTTIEGRWILAFATVLIFVASTTTSILMYYLKIERLWYGGRALAESAKTLAWRYMTKAEPFVASLPDQAADSEFLKRLKSVADQRKSLLISMNLPVNSKNEITDCMRIVRALNLVDRRNIYIRDRILNQESWYAKKASDNKTSRQKWLIAAIIAQIGALISGIIPLLWPDSWLLPMGFFASLAASIIAWLQVKQHQELTQSYAQAAHELHFIAEQAKFISSDDQLSTFVADAENAISREHTLWIARRDAVED